MNITNVEGCRFTVVRVGIFPRSKEEEEGEDDNVCDGLGTGGIGPDAEIGGHADDVNRYGFDAPKRGVIFLVAGQQASQAKVYVPSGG